MSTAQRNGLGDLKAARTWVLAFLAWYNERHQHRAIGYLTPGQRHRGEAEAILKKRRAIYEQSRQAHPKPSGRFLNRCTNPNFIRAVTDSGREEVATRRSPYASE